MSEMIHVFMRTVEVITLLYALLIFIYTIGWYLLKQTVIAPYRTSFSVSVLVAVRNEELHIEHLLNDLACQDYPPGLCEIIIANDHSEDATVERITAWMKVHNHLNVKLIHCVKTGKKSALSEALFQADGTFVLVTDADCRLPATWITAMVGYLDQAEVKLVLGPVVLQSGTGIFGKLQSLEFMSLIGSTAGSCGVGFPAMANGANLGYERAAALALGNDAHNTRYASGDDVFLLHAMTKMFGMKAVVFALHEDALVKTNALLGMKAFLQQRLRWVSKSRAYRNAAIILPALLVFLFNLTLLLIMVSAVFYPFLIPVYVLLTVFKFIIDYPLLSGVGSFMKSRHLLVWMLPLEIIYPFYIVFTAVAGNIIPISWKGRKTM